LNTLSENKDGLQQMKGNLEKKKMEEKREKANHIQTLSASRMMP